MLIGPQAVGAHVDHVAVYSAIERCGLPSCLWLDFPYSARSAHRRSPFDSEFTKCSKQILCLRDIDIAVKIDAAMTYRSQIGYQFGGAAAAAEIIKRDGASECLLFQNCLQFNVIAEG